jgi:hypothetical protein
VDRRWAGLPFGRTARARIEVRDDDVMHRLHKLVRHDWEHSHPLDLSDGGLLADLEGRIAGAQELLAITYKRGEDLPALATNELKRD